MAVLDEQSAEVQVLVEGQPAPEYDNDDDTELDTDTQVTKYVEVVSGKEFSFRIILNPGFSWGQADVVVARPNVDGKKRTGIVMNRANYRGLAAMSGNITGEWSASGNDAKHHKFVFTELETRDMERTDDAANMKDQYGELGTFKVELWREEALDHHDGSSNFQVDMNKAIPEKALKGRPLDVATSFKTTFGKRPGVTVTKKIDQEPFAVFCFKHRTRKALKSLLIVDRTPSPVLPEERPVDELSREELEEMVRNQRANATVKQENRSLKRERANTNSTPRPPLKTSRSANGQTVYIIDSDEGDEVEPQQKASGRRSSPDDPEVEIVNL